MIRFLFFSLSFLVALGISTAQGVYNPKEYNQGAKGIIYDKEFSGDLQLNTNGLTLGVQIGKLKTYYKTNFYYIGIGELKHQKEYKNRENLRASNFQENARSYILGKQNNLYVIRVGKGVKRYFSEKAKRKGLAVGMSYEFGPTLGLLKPYYLEIKKTGDHVIVPTIVSEKFTGDNADTFLHPASIFGASPVVKGLGEIQPRAGIHAKFGLHFDWGAFDEFVKALEVGIMGDLFLGEINLMVEDVEWQNPDNSSEIVNILPSNVRNRPFFINLYVSVLLGKRW